MSLGTDKWPHKCGVKFANNENIFGELLSKIGFAKFRPVQRNMSYKVLPFDAFY
jgi:hypothetical protein